MLPPKVKDISGHRFGKLTACDFVGIVKHRAIWSCHCDCGRDSEHPTSDLRSGNTTSCGCVKASIGKTSNLTHGASAEGKTTRTYNIYRSMIQRCTNPNSKSYGDYGGRGIGVCDEWLKGYVNFLAEMGECPDGYSIERLDVNGNYTRSNCKWIPQADQARNTRKTVWYLVDGVQMIQADLAKMLGLSPSSVWQMRKENRLPTNVKALTA